MVVFLLKLIFFTMTFISNTGGTLDLLSHRPPSGATDPWIQCTAIHGALQQISEIIKSCSEYFMNLVMEAIIALISASFDFLKGGVTGSASVTTSAIGGLIEKTKTSLDGLPTDIPEVFEGFSEMVATIVMDLWNNYKDALGYVIKNA